MIQKKTKTIKTNISSRHPARNPRELTKMLRTVRGAWEELGGVLETSGAGAKSSMVSLGPSCQAA
jgi:hypothetical protein